MLRMAASNETAADLTLQQTKKATLSLKNCEMKLDMRSVRPQIDPRTVHSNVNLNG